MNAAGYALGVLLGLLVLLIPIAVFGLGLFGLEVLRWIRRRLR